MTPTTEEAAGEMATVMAAMDLVDSAGFHDMAEDLATATEVNPRYATTVGNVLVALGVAAWPPELSAAADELAGALADLQAALEAGDLAAAGPAVEAVHGAQHELSEATYGWLGGEAGTLAGAGPAGEMATVMAAMDLVDSAGFHDMAEDLATATEVNPRYATTVGNVLVALGVAAWPPELSAAADELAGALADLQAALEAGDLAAAGPAVEAVHGAQHEFSEATYGWLGGQAGMMSEATMGPHDGPVMVACHLKAIDLVDSAGFHDMAEDLATATEVNPRHATTVGNVLVALGVAAWPPELSAAADELAGALADLQAALEAGDLAAAGPAVEAVHGAQHELSEATYGWLGSI